MESLNKKERLQRNKGPVTGYSSQTTRFPNGSLSNQGNKLFESRRAKGFFYKCGDKYHIGHQCKQKQLNGISATTNQNAEEPEEAECEETTLDLQEKEVVDEAISLNALSGIEVPNTIKLRGESKKNNMFIFLDSGSTHSFFRYRDYQENGVYNQGDLSYKSYCNQ